MALRVWLIAGILGGIVASPAVGETYLGCGNRGDFSFTVRPRLCFLDWPDLPLAYAISPQRMRWSTWGGRVARGAGVYKVKDRDPWQHVLVFAYARRDCGRRTLYTRVRVAGRTASGRRWARTWRTTSCAFAS